MPHLIDEIVEAFNALKESEAQIVEISRLLRESRQRHRDCDEELSRLMRELKTGESRFPLLERLGTNGESTKPKGCAKGDAP